MATSKQRYQNLSLGDTARLQSFVLNNGIDILMRTVAKVEIFKKVPEVASLANPQGLVLVETLVSHLGQPTTEIFPWPDAVRPQYWETDLYIDPDMYQIADYVDRWHYILDENYDFYYPVGKDPYPDDNQSVGSLGDFMGIVGLMKRVVQCTATTTYLDTAGAATTFNDIITDGLAVGITGSMGTDGIIAPVTIRQQVDASQRDSYDFFGTVSAGSVPNLTFELFEAGRTRHVATIPTNRKIRNSGITDGSGTIVDFSYTDVLAKIEDATDRQGIQRTTSPQIADYWAIPSGLYADPLSIAGYVITEYTGYPNTEGPPPDPTAGTAPSGGRKYSYFRLSSSDGENWTGYIQNNPGMTVGYQLDSMTAITNSDGLFMITCEWTLSTPTIDNVSICAWCVEDWRIEGVTYDPAQENAWDSLIDRTSAQLQSEVDHSFSVYPEQWIASSRPISIDWSFDAEPSSYFVNTISWMRVTVRPVVPFQPETERYHFTLLASGTMRYEIYQIQSGDASRFRKIASGTAWWHEENQGVVRIDTTRYPLNRGMKAFIVFYIDLPDGSSIRSSKITFEIQDDLCIGVQTNDVVY